MIKSDIDLEKWFLSSNNTIFGETFYYNEPQSQLTYINLLRNATHYIKDIKKIKNRNYFISIDTLFTNNGIVIEKILQKYKNTFKLKKRIVNNKLITLDIIEINIQKLRKLKLKELLNIKNISLY